MEEKRKLSILITSFGFKNGILMDGDLIFDVRFLPNPYYISELKEISGQNEEVKKTMSLNGLKLIYLYLR